MHEIMSKGWGVAIKPPSPPPPSQGEAQKLDRLPPLRRGGLGWGFNGISIAIISARNTHPAHAFG